MIDLGRKEEYGLTTATPAKDEPRISYPYLSITSGDEMDVPAGEFMATVKLKTKGVEWSEDEKGKKRCTYRFDVIGIEPEDAAEEDAEDSEEAPDAAMAIMEGMKKARSNKMAEDGE